MRGAKRWNGSSEAPFYRQARFTEHYNQLRLTFEGGYAVTFRVFDQGCAYRIETHLPGERTVAGEVAEFNFAGDPGIVRRLFRRPVQRLPEPV